MFSVFMMLLWSLRFVDEFFKMNQEAFEEGLAPRVVLSATHEATLELVTIEDLKRHAIDLA